MMEVIVQQFSNWMLSACILTLLAIGYSMLFGVLDVLHFSHGDVCFVAPFTAIALFGLLTGGAALTGTQVLLGIGVAVIAIGLLGAIIYLTIIRPFEKRDQLIVLVATVSLGVVIRQLIRHIFPEGETAHAFPSILRSTAFEVYGVSITTFQVTAVVSTIALLVAVYLFLNKTTAGLHVRAIAQDAEVAQMYGIGVLPIAFLCFIIVSAIGAIGALFFAINIGAIRFDYGILAGILGFSAAVIGGLGSIYGAILGAMLLAGAETIVQSTVTGGGAYTQVVAFTIVIVFLIFKPTGILGTKAIIKV